jgi:hypothetical protein
MSKRIALIVIGRYKEEWKTLSPDQQYDFVARVGKTISTFGLIPVTGYRLTSTPGTFMEIWEADTPAKIEGAVKNLEAFGYTRYVDARWLVGERALDERAQDNRAPDKRDGGRVP